MTPQEQMEKLRRLLQGAGYRIVRIDGADLKDYDNRAVRALILAWCEDNQEIDIRTKIETRLEAGESARTISLDLASLKTWFVVATGEDAEEWERLDSYDEAVYSADTCGPGSTVWRAEDYDADQSEDGPLYTVD